MLGRVAHWLDAQIGVSGTSDFDCALLRERFVAVKRQMPWLYGMLIANLLGVLLAFRGEGIALTPPVFLIGIMVSRAAHWVRLRPQELLLEAIRRELRKTYLVAALYFAVSFAWTLDSFLHLSAEDSADLAIFAGLAAIGASGGLSSYPAAAKLPLSMLGLPFALILATVSKPALQGIGLSLIVVIFIRLRMLKVQDRTFEELVISRFLVESEKLRAIAAERSAIAEHHRVATIACSDPLTGLANRRGFLEEIDRLNSEAKRKLALILFDLDGFKPINDTFGHPSGDALLVEVGRRLQALSAGEGLVARLGGDEFAVLRECGNSAEAFLFAQAAVGSLCAPFSLDGRTMRITACAGISYQEDDNITQAMGRADIALYEAKRRKRGSVSLFSGQMERHVQRRISLEQALRQPGMANDVQLAFQPIFQLDSMELRSFEALARWQHPELGWVSPSEFIPITEQIWVLEQISDALLERAAAAARDWPSAVRLSFNLSPVQLCSANMSENVLRLIGQQQIEPGRLQIEVTETALLADFETARRNLSQLRSKGVRIVLDDFGAGYSSISYLREMHFDVVKLDGTLISPVADHGKGLALLQGVLALCREMGRPCVAEHIETDEQVQLLRKLGCRYGQGYRLSPPVDAAAAAELARPQLLQLRSNKGNFARRRASKAIGTVAAARGS